MGVSLFFEVKRGVVLKVESKKEMNPEGFYPEVLEAFLSTTKVFLFEEHPMLLRVIGFLEERKTISALCLIKVMRNERGVPLPKSFGRVEQLVYASI